MTEDQQHQNGKTVTKMLRDEMKANRKAIEGLRDDMNLGFKELRRQHSDLGERMARVEEAKQNDRDRRMERRWRIGIMAGVVCALLSGLGTMVWQLVLAGGG